MIHLGLDRVPGHFPFQNTRGKTAIYTRESETKPAAANTNDKLQAWQNLSFLYTKKINRKKTA